MKALKLVSKTLKSLLAGDDDRLHPSESYTRDPINPQFGRLSDHLNYAAYDEKTQLFYLDTVEGSNSISQGLGFTIELSLLSGANDETMKRLASVFLILPKDTTCQIQLFGNPNIDGFLSEYVSNQGNNLLNPVRAELFRFLALKRAAWWRKGTFESLYPGNPMRFREFKAILSVVFPDASFTDQIQLERILNIREGLVAGLRTSNLYHKTWEPDDLLAWARDILNPQRLIYGKQREIENIWDKENPLREQIVFPNTCLHIPTNGCELIFGREENGDAVSVRNLSLYQYPETSFHLANMSALNGDPVQINLNYSCPFLITLNVLKEDYEKSKTYTTMKSARATQNAGSPMARMMPDFAKRQNDWKLAQESFDDGSGGTIRLIHQLTLFDKPERITSSEHEATQLWQNNGFSMSPDQFLQMQSFLSIMPMGLDKEMLKDLQEFKRFSIKKVTNAVSMSPVTAEWSGIGSPYIGLFGRNGQAMSIDLFSNPSGNYNAAVVGTSGSGKSFFINEIVRNYLGAGGQVWVIDVGRSYQKFCEFIGGQYIEFNESSNIVINPFDLVEDFLEDLAIMKSMFAMMIAPNDSLGDYEMAGLERCIQAAWLNKKQQATIDDLQTELLQYTNSRGFPDEAINRLGEQIYPFTSKGVHGKWFNGATTLNFNNELVILEMEELKSKPDLQAVIMRFVLFRITTSMYLSRKNLKVVAIDEAWDLLAGGNSAGKFIEEGYRRARKYRGSFLTGTQGVNDYLESPPARAALNNSDWIFLLRGKEESIVALETKITMTEHMKRMIRSLNTATGQYSDIFVYVAGRYGVGRLVSDPFNALLSSSRAEDFEDIKHKQALGMTISQAVEAVLLERGHTIQ